MNHRTLSSCLAGLTLLALPLGCGDDGETASTTGGATDSATEGSTSLPTGTSGSTATTATTASSGSTASGSSGSGSTGTASGSATETATGTATTGSTTDDPTGTTGSTTASTTDDPTGSTTDDPTGSTTDDPTGSTTDDPTGSTTDDPTGSTTDDPTGSTTDVTATGSTTDVTATGSTTDEPPCQVQQPTVTYVPPNLLFVLDKSGSMTGQTPTTRWFELHSVVTDVVTQFQDRIQFGVELFPDNSGGCNVSASFDIPPVLNNLATILAGIPVADVTIPGDHLTPMQTGYVNAVNWINANGAGRTNAIVLLADGAISDGRVNCTNCTLVGGQLFADPNPNAQVLSPNCPGNTVNGLTTAITNARNAGVNTYVVGIDIPPTNNDQVVGGITVRFPGLDSIQGEMNGYAVAGGVPGPGGGFYNTQDVAALQTAFETIVDDVVSCTIDLSDPPPFPDLTQVEVGGMSYPFNPTLDCATQDGWRYLFDGMGEINGIELCGAACDGFKVSLAADVEYFCTAG